MTKIADSKLDFLQKDIYTGVIKPLPYTTDQLNAMTDAKIGWLAEDSTKKELVRWSGTEWDPVSGGGEDIFEVVVTTADELTQAIADGHNRIAVLADITMNANITFLVKPYYYFFLSAPLRMANFSFDMSNRGYIYFYGPSHLQTGITYAPTTEHPLFINDSASDELHFNHIVVTNSALAINNTPIANNAVIVASHASLSGGNGTNSGPNIPTFDSRYDNCSIDGSFTMAANSVMSDCTVEDGTLTLDGANKARIEGCRFNDCNIVVNANTSEAVFNGCVTDGTTTFTDNGVDTHRAGNDSVIGNDYGIAETGTHNTTWSGIWASAQTGNIEYSILDGQVILKIPEVGDTKTIGSASITATTPLPENLRPSGSTLITVIQINDNGTIELGAVAIDSAGDIFISRGDNSNFSAGTGGTGGFNATYISYFV